MARRMRYGTWCGKDPDDETKIVYTFHMKERDGHEHTERFTSDDPQSFSMLVRLREAWIKSIEKVSGHWAVELYED